MTDRRYSEREIREVFERAAREQEQAAAAPEPDGLTLDEMREIAASAGIAPEFVERAAHAVALGEPEQGRLSLGPVPRGVFHTALLPEPPSDALWDALVADLRSTFEAQGTVTETGAVREWRNGNLRAILEPAGDGSRLHLRTRRDSVPTQVFVLGMLSFVSLYAVLMSTIDSDAGKLALGAVMGVLGALVGGNLWFGQRRWAATRETQMAEVAARAAARSHEARPGLDASPARLDAALLDDAPSAERTTGSVGPRTRA